MGSAIHHHQLRGGAVGEHLDLVLGIRNGVYDILGSLDRNDFNVNLERVTLKHVEKGPRRKDFLG